jgi:hypothetical protein
MIHPDNPSSSPRATLLTLLFGLMIAAVIFACALLFFGLFFIQALGVLGIIAAFGVFHYFLWGHSFSRTVEDAGEAESNGEAADDWPLGPPRRF